MIIEGIICSGTVLSSREFRGQCMCACAVQCFHLLFCLVACLLSQCSHGARLDELVSHLTCADLRRDASPRTLLCSIEAGTRAHTYTHKTHTAHKHPTIRVSSLCTHADGAETRTHTWHTCMADTALASRIAYCADASMVMMSEVSMWCVCVTPVCVSPPL